MQKDKILHFVVALILMFITYYFVQNILIAGLIVLTIGLFKEIVIDNIFGKGDLVADVVGILLAMSIIFTTGI